MTMLCISILLSSLVVDRALCWQGTTPGNPSPPPSRRSFLTFSIGAATGSFLTSSPLFLPSISSAAHAAETTSSSNELVDVYFGCGCFWHVQFCLCEAERNILGRSDEQLTSRAGYAGGNLGMKDGKVCYHNIAQVSDYGKLGHAEVVSMKIPKDKFSEFAVEYCKLFRNGMRPDQAGDRGLEYRNLVGFPGGSKSDLAMKLVEASKATGDQLDFAVGKGGDATSKGKDGDIPRLVWIMDSDAYPSYVAEAYHQFHDGFNWGEDYPASYNNLAKKFEKYGEDFGSCPRM
ncbi:MAG: hypothetical protein SGILL_003529 [Bacillariaceae sp.]